MGVTDINTKILDYLAKTNKEIGLWYLVDQLQKAMPGMLLDDLVEIAEHCAYFLDSKKNSSVIVAADNLGTLVEVSCTGTVVSYLDILNSEDVSYKQQDIIGIVLSDVDDSSELTRIMRVGGQYETTFRPLISFGYSASKILAKIRN